MRWTSRYAAGEVVAVWDEVVAAGAPPTADAIAVARELVRRAGRNARRVHDHLAATGYAFEAEEPLRPPPPDVVERLAAMEEQVAPVPLALRAWAEEVGTVNLNGTFAEPTIEYPDPFWVELRPDDAVEVHRDWIEMGLFTRRGQIRFPVDLAPDAFHKADVSGGPPYGVELPDDAIDPTWRNDDAHPDATFVGYLRSALLRHAGFPGWARPDAPPLPPDLAALAQRLEPF
jgi:hypothetical protein